MKNFIKPLLALKTKSGYSIFSVVIVAVFSVWGITDALQAEVTYAADGNSQVVKSSDETVGELLEDLEIEVTNNDYISHSIEESLEDGMEIEHITAKEVVVVIDGKKEIYETIAEDVKTLFKEHKLDISKHDKVSHNLNTEIKDGLVINIDKAYKIPVNYAGEEESVWTTGGTVGEVLSENDFKIKKSDKVNPAKKEQVTKNTEIEVTKVTKDTIVEKEATNFEVKEEKKKIKDTNVEKEATNFEVKEEKNSKLEKDKTNVIQKGRKGSVEKTYELVLENGKEVERKEVDKEVLKKPKNKIVSVGTKSKPKLKKTKQSPSNVSSKSGGQTKTMQATAYTAKCDTGCTGITATAQDAKPNPNKKLIAGDPAVIPLGSRVYVEGYGEATAGDTGGDIKVNRRELHFPDKATANSFGRQNVTVRIID